MSSFFDVELYKDVLDVGLDGLRCDSKKLCYFLVGSTLGNQGKYLALARAKRLRKSWGRSCLDLGLVPRSEVSKKTIDV